MAKLENLGDCAGCPALDYCNSLLLDVTRSDMSQETPVSPIPDSPLLVNVDPEVVDRVHRYIDDSVTNSVEGEKVPSFIRSLQDYGLDIHQGIALFKSVLDEQKRKIAIEKGNWARQELTRYNVNLILDACTQGVQNTTSYGVGMLACGSPELTEEQRDETMVVITTEI